MVYTLLSQCHPHMTAYLKEDIPEWLHYRNNEFIQPILLVADEGWTIVQRGDKPNHCMDLSLKWCTVGWLGFDVFLCLFFFNNRLVTF